MVQYQRKRFSNIIMWCSSGIIDWSKSRHIGILLAEHTACQKHTNNVLFEQIDGFLWDLV